MKLSITGSREFGEFQLVGKVLSLIRKHLPIEEDLWIISGAKTDDIIYDKNLVDAHALAWANNNDEPFVMFPPKWKRDGKSAGIKRNPKIVDSGTFTISFWDGASKGTKNTIDYAVSKNKYLGNVLPNGDLELTELGKVIFKELGIEAK